MEVQDLPAGEYTLSQSNSGLDIDVEDLDRIAFELWQRGSVPDIVSGEEAEVEEVACHASCL